MRILTFVLLSASLPAVAQVIRGPGFPPDLQRYLSLTNAEIAYILQSDNDYNTVASSMQQQISDLYGKIAAVRQQTPLDAQAIGTYYAGIELIRRDLTKRQSDLAGTLRGSLDNTQQGQLDALAAAAAMQGLISEAQCENLFDSAPVGGVMPFFGLITFANTSTISSCTPGFPTDLQQYLGLSNDQAASIARLNSDNRKKQADNQQQIAQLQARITQETAKDPLDPLALGALYVQVDTIERGTISNSTTLRAATLAVLNDMQRAKLNTLGDASKLQLLIGEATFENLLPGGLSVCSASAFFDPSSGSSYQLCGVFSAILPP
jgi:TolA-binding protein